MGVKIRELAKKGIKTIKFKELKKIPLAIDTFNIIFQFLSTIRQANGDLLKDSQGRITSHLLGLFYRSINYLENDMKPLFIYDGEAPSLKWREIEKRKKARKKAEKMRLKSKKLGNLEQMKKYAKRTSTLDQQMINESKELLKYFGFPIIQAPSEGEAQAAYMVNEEEIWGVFTKDYDALIYGAKRVLRNLKLTKRKKPEEEEEVRYISLSKLLSNLDINQEQLVEMSILIGNDFFPGIKGVGQKTALKLIRKYKSLDEILEKGIKIRGRTIEINKELVSQIKEIFLQPNISKDYASFSFTEPDFNMIREFMIEKHEFSEEKINNALHRIL